MKNHTQIPEAPYEMASLRRLALRFSILLSIALLCGAGIVILPVGTTERHIYEAPLISTDVAQVRLWVQGSWYSGPRLLSQEKTPYRIWLTITPALKVQDLNVRDVTFSADRESVNFILNKESLSKTSTDILFSSDYRDLKYVDYNVTLTLEMGSGADSVIEEISVPLQRKFQRTRENRLWQMILSG